MTDSSSTSAATRCRRCALAAQAGEALGVDISVREVFTASTVRALAAAVAGNAEALSPIVAVEPRPARVPLSFAQQRMWFINRFEASAATYNIPAVLRLTGSLDVDALRQSVIDVLARHEVLARRSRPKPAFTSRSVTSPSSTPVGIWRVVDSDDALFASATAGFDVTTQVAVAGDPS